MERFEPSAVCRSPLLVSGVSNRRSEARKWHHCFSNVDVIVYCISLAEYDLVEWGDEKFVRACDCH